MKAGQIVTYHQPAGEKSLGNGAVKHVAVITAVWSKDRVNLKVLPDCGEIQDRTSVPRAFHSGMAYGFEE